MRPLPLPPQVVSVGTGKMKDGALVRPNVEVGQTVMYSKYSGTEFEVRQRPTERSWGPFAPACPHFIHTAPAPARRNGPPVHTRHPHFPQEDDAEFIVVRESDILAAIA